MIQVFMLTEGRQVRERTGRPKRMKRGKATTSEERHVARDEGRKLNVGWALNLSLIMCGLLNQQSP